MGKRTHLLALAVVLVLGLFGFAGCGQEGHTLSDQTKAVVAGNNAFALELYGRLRSTNSNLFFSPFSISGCLATVHAGARGNTEKQMAAVLHLGTNQVQAAFGELNQLLNRRRTGIELSVANGLWTQKGQPLLPAFLKISQEQLGANVRQFDFLNDAASARSDINQWASEKTKGMIKGVIPPGMLGRDSKLVLVSAIYFKGVWKTKFDPKETRPGVFHLNAKQTIQCPMMFCAGKFRLGHYTGPGLSCDVLELPYAGRNVSLIAILPSHWDGLADLENNLTETNLSTLLDSTHETSADVSLPKLKFNTSFDLDKRFSAMGMTDAFQTNADFSGIDGTKSLFISSIQHQAFVEIDEEGTTAAATTTTHYKTQGMSPRFRADHPFLFLIRDNRSGSILFLGRVMDPTKQGR